MDLKIVFFNVLEEYRADWDKYFFDISKKIWNSNYGITANDDKLVKSEGGLISEIICELQKTQ